MAIIPYTVVELKAAKRFTWSGMTTGDVGEPIADSDLGDKTYHVVDADGATIAIKGSNDGANYVVLHDNFNAAASHSSAALGVLNERPAFVRPECSGGSSPSATVIIQASRVIR